ncbi:GDSL-type esterase/lipase family protein [Paenibacillus sp. 481]|uniref:GDSL-type esterase/lipase family protein n=1 Tax=Paenibacillus sp. 481 TaxID=2835869 RepID=UPI001E5E1271|nr:GDSL-type esterase/lipase family protein [Paenibacillus sp. 481]UHA73032.1 GDSL family lipase [Paenibacillus sp. 481]
MKNNKSTSRQWRIMALCGLLSTLVLVVGFGFGVANILSPASVPFAQVPTENTPKVENEANSNEIRIVSIGDSLTRGTGDGTGDGYVRRVVRLLKEEQDKPVTLLNNLGINGLRADQLSQRLQEQSMGYTLKQADVILLTIGGNDLFQSAQADQLSDKELDKEAMLAKVDKSIPHLSQVLSSLRKWNPHARIVYAGLYNPFADLAEMREIGNSVVQKWNDEAYQIINKDPNMVLVPTHDLFQQNINKHLSSDHFHPNDKGYEAIAKRIVQSIH